MAWSARPPFGYGSHTAMVHIRMYASVHILVQHNRPWIKNACRGALSLNNRGSQDELVHRKRGIAIQWQGVGKGQSYPLRPFVIPRFWTCSINFLGWESQILETGFLATFLCPLLTIRRLPRKTPTSFIVILGFRWLIFRIMLGAVSCIFHIIIAGWYFLLRVWNIRELCYGWGKIRVTSILDLRGFAPNTCRC